MLVHEIMSSPAFSVHVDSPLDEALQIMAEHSVTNIPVVDDGGHLVGVLSEIDLLRRAVEPDTRAHAIPVHPGAPLPRTVGEIMTTSPRSTHEHADVADLIRMFTTNSFKSLPVLRDGLLVGVISRGDVIRALWRRDEDLLADLQNVFHEYGQDRWTISVSHGVATITGTGSSRERAIASAMARSVLGVRRVHVEPA